MVSYSKVVISSIFEFKMKLNSVLVSSLPNVQPEYPLFVFCQGWMEPVSCCDRKQQEVAFDVRCLAIPRDDLTSWDVLTEKVLELIHAELKQTPPVGLSVVSPLAVVWRSRRLHRLSCLSGSFSSTQLRLHRSPWFGWASELVHWVPPFLSSWRTGAVLACLGCILPAIAKTF